MAEFITGIRTSNGVKQIDWSAIGNPPAIPDLSEDGLIDYNNLANKPDLSADGLGISVESLGAASADHTHTFFSIGTSSPSDTALLWIDTTADTGGLKYYNGSEWIHVPVAYT